jgi:serine/threonine protein phosphatase PrpC
VTETKAQPTQAVQRVIAGQDLLEPELLELAGGLAAFYSSSAPDKYSGNEDALGVFGVDDARALLVVADGMGGAAAGARASSEAIAAVKRSVRRLDEQEPTLRSPVLDAFDDANQRVLDLGVGAATTLCIAELAGDQLRVYHVGDSAALVVGQRGKLKLQTIAHSPVGYALESGLLDESEALHHDERHVVSNVIGARDMRIDVGSPVRIARRDTVLLGSDGLFDNVALDEIVACIRCGPLDECARRLLEVSAQRMRSPAEGEPSKPDDLSFVLYRMR